MRKTLLILLLAALVLTAAGCDRGPDPNATPTPEPTPDPAAVLAASDTDTAAAAQSHVPPASSTDTALSGAEQLAKAQQCLGMTLEELYAAIGQPVGEAIYGPSIVQEGAEDGTLPYDGFTVWTVRSDAGEFVHEVQPIIMDQPAQ